MKIFSLLIITGLSFMNGRAQEVDEVNYKQLDQYISSRTSEIQVVNFWATWCKPCVVELLFFTNLQKTYKSEKLEVVFVSLDFPEELESKVKPFILKKDLQGKVLLLDDLDANNWINQVDTSWSGAIPATLIIKDESRIFIEGELTQEELNIEIDKIIKE